MSMHLGGTCRMGDGNNKNAVVDERLRVRNVKGLRVIDASVMPRLITGGTYSSLRHDWRVRGTNG